MSLLLGQSLQHGGQQDRLLGLLEDPEVDEEDDVERLCVLVERKRYIICTSR